MDEWEVVITTWIYKSSMFNDYPRNELIFDKTRFDDFGRELWLALYLKASQSLIWFPFDHPGVVPEYYPLGVTIDGNNQN